MDQKKDVGVGIDIQELQMQDIEDVGLDLDDDIPVWESAHDKTLELTEGVRSRHTRVNEYSDKRIMYTLIGLWALSVVCVLVRCFVVWPGSFDNSASSKRVTEFPTLSASNSTVCPSYNKDRALTFTHSTTGDYEFGTEYYCSLKMMAPYVLKRYAERRVQVSVTLDNGQTVEFEEDQSHEFLTERLFIIGGCPSRSCDSWSAVVTLTQYEEYVLADQFYLECVVNEVWGSSFWTSVCGVCAVVAFVALWWRVKTVGFRCICSLNYAEYLRSMTREQQHLLALNVCTVLVSTGAVFWIGFKFSLSANHDKATVGSIFCLLMIKVGQSCFLTIFLSLMDMTNSYTLVVWGFGLVLNTFHGTLGWIGVLNTITEPTFFAREAVSAPWIQLASLALYFAYWRVWQMMSLRSWQYLDSQPYEEVRSRIIQFAYTQMCTGLVAGALVLSALVGLFASSFGAYELWVFSIFPSIMGVEVVVYTVYTCLMLHAYSRDPNRDFKALLNVHEFNYSPYSQHCASNKRVYEHRRSCLVEQQEGGYKEQLERPQFDLTIARLGVLCSDQVYKCLEPDEHLHQIIGTGKCRQFDYFEPRDPSSLMNRCPRTSVLESVRKIDEENYEDTHMTFLKQSTASNSGECTYAVADFGGSRSHLA
eukprot:TRINITY_DN5586_c0_g1_i5.p1 TRINITY_DN5586_c0_g1~~TRINITY_DN5586_c0_g1_i5.p1  ORF type:complete len:647 (+),score=126.39 TRINITY_DN5586_c0_g1_i5:82-2022(+)